MKQTAFRCLAFVLLLAYGQVQADDKASPELAPDAGIRIVQFGTDAGDTLIELGAADPDVILQDGRGGDDTVNAFTDFIGAQEEILLERCW